MLEAAPLDTQASQGVTSTHGGLLSSAKNDERESSTSSEDSVAESRSQCEQVCFVCANDDGELLRNVCACTSMVHLQCQRKLVTRLPAYSNGNCAVCLRTYKNAHQNWLPRVASCMYTALAVGLPFVAVVLIVLVTAARGQVLQVVSSDMTGSTADNTHGLSAFYQGRAAWLREFTRAVVEPSSDETTVSTSSSTGSYLERGKQRTACAQNESAMFSIHLSHTNATIWCHGVNKSVSDDEWDAAAPAGDVSSDVPTPMNESNATLANITRDGVRYFGRFTRAQLYALRTREAVVSRRALTAILVILFITACLILVQIVASGPPVVLTKFGAGVSVVRKSARGHIHELQSGAHGGSRSLSEQIGDMIDARCLHMHGFMTAHDGRPAYTLYMV
uniref:Uncharacterized protein n=1 Tax=Chrysotila carterae TaxID=13221 RepID=A0A6T0B5K7_CHRCT|mmetsp:Transcript_9186/g.20076  ORF Transcript_9186/g.20076 Transcript_9186/m.20076 type:complete len:391 (+) Transcript_9186:304-1476(+)